MVTKFKGDCAKNARIKINYQGVKPKVTFSYPDKKRQYSGSMFIYILGPIILIGLILYITYNAGYTSILDMTYDKTALQTFAECVTENPNQTLTNYSYVRDDLCGDDELFLNPAEIFLSKNSPLLWVFIGPFALTALIYYPFRKKYWMNVYPKFMAWRAKKKQVIFKEKDVQHNGEYYCEVPLFDNVILDYIATEDFSKYLKFFEIREHHFKYYKPIKRKKKRNAKTKLGAYLLRKHEKEEKNERKKDRLNEWLWYAKFYFSEKPIKGKLEVIFK